MKIATIEFKWEEETTTKNQYGYNEWKLLRVGDTLETGFQIVQCSATAPIELHGSILSSVKTFTDIRDAEEFAENEFKKYLNAFLEHAKPVLDIAAFARF